MRIRRGVCYLLENETSETAYRLFLRLLPEQEAGFCLSRMHPEKVRTRFGSANVRIGWLAEVPGEDHFSANAMASVAKAIQQFIQEHGSSGIVLIDGLEYVILHNGFQPTLLAFVEHLNEFTMGTQAIVLIAFRPQTLDPRELALLERNLQVLEGADVKSQLDVEELGEILGVDAPAEGTSTEKIEATKVLSPLPDMGGLQVERVRCPKCGIENDAEVAFCVYCGSLLPDRAGTTTAPTAPPAPRTSPALKPNPPVARAVPERRPHFVGLIGVAFSLLIVGIVVALPPHLLNDLRFWSDLIATSGLLVRPAFIEGHSGPDELGCGHSPGRNVPTPAVARPDVGLFSATYLDASHGVVKAASFAGQDHRGGDRLAHEQGRGRRTPEPCPEPRERAMP